MDIKLPMARSGLSVVDAMQSAGTFDDSSVRDGLFLSTLAEKCGWCAKRFSPTTVAPLERVPHPTMTGVKVAYQYFVRKWWVVGPFERYVNFDPVAAETELKFSCQHGEPPFRLRFVPTIL